MKRISVFLLAALMMFAFCSCGKSEPVSGVANPMHSTDADGIYKELGIRMTPVEGSSDVSYFLIDGSPVIGQMGFSHDGRSYTFRAAKCDSFLDISGMYFTWTESSELPVGTETAKVSLIGGQQGIIQWHDADSGIMYSLSVDSGADAETLAQVANALYAPIKGGN